ncbi:MAG: efflux transporter outer membrane subunit [Chitinophagaceae bacterium]|nr:efflux transporter outer membrane subunit [Chitinophagaceae bacterium]
MLLSKINRSILLMSLVAGIHACKTPVLNQKTESNGTPAAFAGSSDSANSGAVSWKDYFNDPFLAALIDTALKNNQELNILLQEIEISKNEIQARKGEYLPFVSAGGGAAVEKVGRYTSKGANDATTEIKPGKEMPDPLPDFKIGAVATWEVDIWHKLRNARKAAVSRYLASIEGKNFMVTQLVAEIANSYYELLALDKQLEILKNNIELQNNVLRIVRLEKESAHVTELAVRRFEAQVLHTQAMLYGIQQQITETENRINFLLGRFPQSIVRTTSDFETMSVQAIHAGLPSQLLSNRPDIKKAENELAAAKIDVQVAKAKFYPSLGISAALGYQAFSPRFLFSTPESILFGLAADMAGPLVNKNAIKAEYYNSNAKQTQAVFNYERSIRTAYMEVMNQLSMIQNLEQTFDKKGKEVEMLNQSVTISNNLFKSARADYMEVLLTQREALDARFELIETKKKQMNAMVNIYQALGGGWR